MHIIIHYIFCAKFNDTFKLLDHSLAQLVDTPQRKENILDIFATNCPSLATDCPKNNPWYQ